MPTVTQLEYVVAVDQCRHFGRAAAMANVSQPTLSAQLRKLEEELGVPLFDRRKKPILPTEEGTPLIEQARVVLHEVRRFAAMADREAEDVAGQFRLGVIPTVAPFILPLFLDRFSQAYPRVELHVEELPTDRIIDQLDRDTLHAGILSTPLGLTRIEEEPLFYETLQVYVGRNHRLASARRVSPTMLKPAGLWLLSEEHCLREQVIVACGSGDQRGCFPSVHLKGGSLETVVELVSGDQGYTVLPSMAAEAIAKRGYEGVIVEFSAPVPAREVSLVHRRGHLKRGIERALRSTIDACLPSELLRTKTTRLNVVSLMGQFK